MLTGDLGVGLVTSGLFGAFGVGEAARRWLHGSARDYVVAAMVAGVGLVCGLISYLAATTDFGAARPGTSAGCAGLGVLFFTAGVFGLVRTFLADRARR